MPSQKGSSKLALDYDHPISVNSFPYTAPQNGILIANYTFWGYDGTPYFYIHVNGEKRLGMYHDDPYAGVSNMVETIVNKGDIITLIKTGAAYTFNIKLIPFK